jgi:signal transduction histidine kinase/DNA-binding response OmpR family regulator
VLLLTALFLSISVQTSAQTSGRLNLERHNFEQEPVIYLDGEWKFYWEQLIPPESIDLVLPDTLLLFDTNWAHIEQYGAQGYATYEALLLMPDEHPSLALDIPDFYSSYRLYINGELFAENGKVSTQKRSYEPQWLPQTLTLGRFSSDTLHLVLHVANFDHSKGGAYLPIELGDARTLYTQRYIDYGYSFILTGALLMGGMFFLGLYFFGRHETTVMYFSLFCIVYSYRIIGFGSYALHFLIPDAPWIVTLRLEYITLFLSGYIFGMYTLTLYPRETSKPLVYVLSAISLLFLAEALVLPPSIFTQLVVPYFIIIICYITYALYIYILAVINRRPGSLFSLISSFMVFFVFLYEIFVYLGFLKTFLLLNFVGYLFFFFFQSLVHSYRFARNMKFALFKAEESSRAKSQFLSTMSHEIRTPLNAVIGLSGLLAESNLSEKQREFSTTIKKSGENLLSIINNILDYSKIESGRLELENSEYNLREVVELAMDVVISTFNKPGVEVMYTFSDDVPHYLMGDSTRLQQVLTNLLTNALKFTEQGEVVLRVSTEQKLSDSVLLRFSISDTGIGIPEKKMNRLFKSFSQVDPSSTRKFGGTGLGLVISKKLVQAMGGDVRVESEEYKGSTFSFSILNGRSERVMDWTTPSLLNGKKAFVLDDNLTNLEIIQNQLERAGVEVTTFNQSSRFLFYSDKLEKFDFGILDLQMPDYDGIEVARKIRQTWSASDLPLVLFSSIHEVEDLDDKKMFSLYLKKPVRQSKFLNNIERIFIEEEKRNIAQQNELPPTKIFQQDYRVLIAEDNIVNQKVAFRILERLGIEPDIADNGKIALEMHTEHGYDLIFMDMEMPEMDGLEATQTILNTANGKATSPIIIAMTANAMDEDRERCFAAGMSDFISKPITIEGTKNMLKKWLDS